MKKQNSTVFGSRRGYGVLIFRHCESVIRQLNVAIFKSTAVVFRARSVRGSYLTLKCLVHRVVDLFGCFMT